MQTILFLSHTAADGSLPASGFEALNAALALRTSLADCSLVAALFGETTQAAANAITESGAARILSVSGADFGSSRYASDAAAIEALCRAANATFVVAPATSRLTRVLPGVAARLNGRVDTHVVGLGVQNGAVAVNRWFYRQRMEASVQRAQRPWFILLDPGSQTPWSGPVGTATVETIVVNLPEASKRTQVVGIRETSGTAQTIRPEAKLLFVAGAGWTKKQADGQPHVKEAETLIRDCLERTRASLGSSKSLVDLGGEGQAVLSFLTHMNQIGQTGATPRHPKGLATCCHGEEPHTVGWRFVTERRAVNLDANCGWARGKADVLYVADAFAVVAKLNELLAPRG
jgi:electron transfer flavoprotein alpha subunit